MLPTTLPAMLPTTLPASFPAALPATHPASLPATLPATLPVVLPATLPATELSISAVTNDIIVARNWSQVTVGGGGGGGGEQGAVYCYRTYYVIHQWYSYGSTTLLR